MFDFYSLWNRYDWPNHIFWGCDQVRNHISCLFWTAYAHVQLRMHGVQFIGKGLRVIGHLEVFARKKGSIRLGENVHLVSRKRSNPVGLTNACILDTRPGGKITIGNSSGMSGSIISSRTRVTIGDYVKIGGNVRIFDHDFHSSNYLFRRNLNDRLHVSSLEIQIGNDVFIGANSIVLKNTIIGDRSIVGAGTVLAGKKIPEDSLVYGNPACVRPL